MEYYKVGDHISYRYWEIDNLKNLQGEIVRIIHQAPEISYSTGEMMNMDRFECKVFDEIVTVDYRDVDHIESKKLKRSKKIDILLNN